MSKTIENLQAEAHRFWRQGDEVSMLAPLSEAIALARETNQLHQLIELLSEFGGALRVTGHTDASLVALEEVVTLIAKYFDDNSVQYATALMNYANALRINKSIHKSEFYFNKALAILHSNQIYDYTFASTINNLALLYIESARFEEVVPLLSEATRILVKDKSLQVPLAITYNNLFEAYFSLGNISQALYYLKNAQQIILKEVGEKHPLYASVMSSWAKYYYSLEDFQKSLSNYQAALLILEQTYGNKSPDYRAIQSNIEELERLTNRDTQNLSFGMKRAMEFFENELFPLVKEKCPLLLERAAFGLVGTGSECFGFDDELSKDHDFERECNIWVPTPLLDQLSAEIMLVTAAFKERIIVQTVEDFYQHFTNHPNGPSSDRDYLEIPSANLAIATNGRIFYDQSRYFTDIREKIKKGFPEDIRLKRLAYHLNQVAQSGQYNYSRCLQREDRVGAFIALSEFVTHYSEVIHLMNNNYMPFYKWYVKSLERCPKLGQNTIIEINKLIQAPFDDEQVNRIEDLCIIVANQLKKDGLSSTSEPFLIAQANEVMAHITDLKLRNSNSWVLGGSND